MLLCDCVCVYLSMEQVKYFCIFHCSDGSSGGCGGGDGGGSTVVVLENFFFD